MLNIRFTLETKTTENESLKGAVNTKRSSATQEWGEFFTYGILVQYVVVLFPPHWVFKNISSCSV